MNLTKIQEKREKYREKNKDIELCGDNDSDDGYNNRNNNNNKNR